MEVSLINRPGDKKSTMEKGPKDNIEALFERISDYIETRVELFKLKATHRTTDIVSELASKLILFAIFFTVTIILNVGIALWLGHILGATYYGFFVVAAFYLVAGLIVFAGRNIWIREPVSKTIIKKLFK